MSSTSAAQNQRCAADASEAFGMRDAARFEGYISRDLCGKKYFFFFLLEYSNCFRLMFSYSSSTTELWNKK